MSETGNNIFQPWSPKISRKDELSRRFISLEEKLKTEWQVNITLTEEFNRNESAIRTIKKNESKMRARAFAGASSGFKKASLYERSFINKNRKLLNHMDRRLQ